MDFWCYICGQSFDDVRAYLSHMLNTHGIYLIPQDLPHPYVPPYTPPEEPSLPYGCSICGAQFHTQEEARAHYEQVHVEEPPLEEPKRCIIATVFLGEDHRLLPPMRKFRDLFLPKLVMDTYYSVSVYVLRKIGKYADS